MTQGDIEVTPKDLAEDDSTIAGLHQTCMSRSQDYETQTKTRFEETKGLANGLHRCFLRLSASSRDVQIVSIDDSFERQEFFDLRFRYFDGQAWQFTSDLLNDRVTAVETVIRIDTRSTSEPGFVNPMPESPNNTYRLTSILPGASPQEGHSL